MAKSTSTKAVSSQSAQNPKLIELEQRLFFRDFSSEDENSRLNRIERQVFGETSTGATEERLARIEAAIPPVEKPQEKPAAPAAAEKQPYRSPQPDDSDAQDEAMEKEKLAVMSAKQEEVSGLLSEGVRLWRAKQGPQAIEKFQQVIRLDPQNTQAYFSLGIAYEGQGSLTEADQCYRAAMAIDPENKECAEALKAIQKKLALKQSIDTQQAQLRNLADDAAKAYQSGEMLSALDLYKQLDDKAPHQALVKWNIGTIYLLLKNPRSALQYYKEASKLKPDEPRYAQAAAQLEQNLKRNEEQQKQSEAGYAQNQPTQNQPTQMQPTQMQPTQMQPRPNSIPMFNPGPPAQPVLPRSTNQRPGKPPEPLQYYGISVKGGKEGVRITGIAFGSRAAQVGLQVGDVIKAVDGNVVTSSNEMNQMLMSKPPGQRFQFTVQREKHLGLVLF